eukprot:scaffold63562_cov54-Phaeocystis_antarctica.AAC.1
MIAECAIWPAARSFVFCELWNSVKRAPAISRGGAPWRRWVQGGMRSMCVILSMNVSHRGGAPADDSARIRSRTALV